MPIDNLRNQSNLTESTPNAVLAPAVLGAILCFAFLLFFGALASGIGLVSFKMEQGQFPRATVQWIGAVYGFAALIISFFVGGFVSSRFARANTRSSSVWFGLGSWSVVIAGIAIFVGSFATSLSSLLIEAGVGAGAAAGAAATADTITNQLSKVRIVTDMKLLKGKAVTQIVVPERGQELAGIAAKQAPHEAKSAEKSLAPAPKVKSEVRHAAETARSVLGGASLVLVGLMLIGAFSAAGGGLLADRSRMKAVR